jgi:nucleoside-diphosphate-sugar epimerase
MRILIIGGTGHIGGYLVPRLLAEGHAVSVVARNPKPRHAIEARSWASVQWIVADRSQEEKNGAWAERLKKIETDVVIDLMAFSPEQNATIANAFAGRIRHFLHCGTIWAYGRPARVPYAESDLRRPLSDYGQKKAQIEADLLERWSKDRFPATIIHPGHICGWGWLPIDPQGTRNGTEVYRRLACEETVYLCDNGRPTIQHVHADDIARLFQLSIENPRVSVGESFSAVASCALTLEACCETVATIFGKMPRLEFVSRETFQEKLGIGPAAATFEHCDHSPCASNAKAQRLLGHIPRYTIEDIYRESIHWMQNSGLLKL